MVALRRGIFPIGNVQAHRRHFFPSGRIPLQTRITTAQELGTFIRAERRRQALTQAGLAALCGVSPRFLGEIEHGRSTAGIGRVLRVCSRLGIDLLLEPRGAPP
ncbi:MAG: helix-turn-helix transcriptional regulator [Deltaproteobacteria bacterium]|nr:helix-turn-helix transcriptional regulator [Deltaproteobacteria bacterium]